jgi:hypothetical protein
MLLMPAEVVVALELLVLPVIVGVLVVLEAVAMGGFIKSTTMITMVLQTQAVEVVGTSALTVARVVQELLSSAI